MGPARGQAVIGRALQLSIPVTLEEGEDPPCVRAELLQGESLGGPLRWRLDREPDGRPVLRLFSTVAIREPVVTVNLTLGCRQAFTRDYVLLAERPDAATDQRADAELPQDVTPLVLAPSTSLALAPPLIQAPPAAAPSTPTPPAPAATRPLRRRAVAAEGPGAAPRERPAAARPRAAAPPTPPPPAKPGGPRLKLEPLDIAIDEAPQLKMSTVLSALPAATVAAAAAAASAPRAAASAAAAASAPVAAAAAASAPAAASPEQLSAQAQAMRALEAQLRQTGELVKRQGERLERLNWERNVLVGALVALLALVAASIAAVTGLRWHQSRKENLRWNEEVSRASVAPSAFSGESESRSPGLPVPDPDPNPVPLHERTLRQPEMASDFSSSFAESMPRVPGAGPERIRVPKAEELLDMKEKADFFLAVGQPEKAMQLLQAQLHEPVGASPYVWLDLLDLCHRLGRREEYEKVRVQFQEQFPARLPPFDGVRPGSQGLEDHPRALSRIILMWGSPRVLKMIEDSLFDDPAPDSIGFDLEASRELLLLYSIAQEHIRQQLEEMEPFPSTELVPMRPTSSTEPVPLAALDESPRSSAPRPDIAFDDLDLDFTLPPAPPPSSR
jgi:hypothetical protein